MSPPGHNQWTLDYEAVTDQDIIGKISSFFFFLISFLRNVENQDEDSKENPRMYFDNEDFATIVCTALKSLIYRLLSTYFIFQCIL